MVPDIVLVERCVFEERVNEFPRESLPKLFSYAVAALSRLNVSCSPVAIAARVSDFLRFMCACQA